MLGRIFGGGAKTTVTNTNTTTTNVDVSVSPTIETDVDVDTAPIAGALERWSGAFLSVQARTLALQERDTKQEAERTGLLRDVTEVAQAAAAILALGAALWALRDGKLGITIE